MVVVGPSKNDVAHKHVARRSVHERHGQTRIIGEVSASPEVPIWIEEVVIEAVLHDGRHRVLSSAVEEVEIVHYFSEEGVRFLLLLEFGCVHEGVAFVRHRVCRLESRVNPARNIDVTRNEKLG